MRSYFLEKTEEPPRDEMGVGCLSIFALLTGGIWFLSILLDEYDQDMDWLFWVAAACFALIKIAGVDIEEGELVAPFRRHTMLVGIAVAKSAKWLTGLAFIAIAFYSVSGVQVDKVTMIIILLVIIVIQLSSRDR
jgi:hypothetical protein